MAHVEARGIVVEGAVGNLTPVPVAFAWAKSAQVPFLLGELPVAAYQRDFAELVCGQQPFVNNQLLDETVKGVAVSVVGE